MAGGVDSRAEEYKNRVLALDHGGLLEMWELLCRGVPLPGWQPGKGLEYLILRAFQLEGAEVTWPYHVRLKPSPARQSSAREPRVPQRNAEQIDGAAHFDGLLCLLECKHHRRPIDLTPITKFKSQLMRRPRMTLGLIFSVSDYSHVTVSRVQELPPVDVLMWRRLEIDRALRRGWLREGTKRKLRYAAENGTPDVDLVEMGDLL